jgi:hypothetical protein
MSGSSGHPLLLYLVATKPHLISWLRRDDLHGQVAR